MIKVVGCGNLLAYDEGLGIHAVREIKEIAPPGVVVLELRRPGLLLQEFVCGARKLIIVDAINTGKTAGVIERLELYDQPSIKAALSGTVHGFNLLPLFERVQRACGVLPENIVLFTMEISERTKFRVGLSAQVKEVLPQLVKMILAEIELDNIAAEN